jgi:hypothetical protein
MSSNQVHWVLVTHSGHHDDDNMRMPQGSARVASHEPNIAGVVEQHDTVLYEQVLKDHVVSEAAEEKS